MLVEVSVREQRYQALLGGDARATGADPGTSERGLTE